MDFRSLAVQRWREAREAVGLPADVLLTGEVKDGYPHFNQKRGYAVCFQMSPTHCHLQFAPKVLKAETHRADGLLRHEIGHAIDFFVPAEPLNRWALSRNVRLPSTDERRADAIALAIWGSPIRYDQDLVQSTEVGVNLRPAHLGL